MSYPEPRYHGASGEISAALRRVGRRLTARPMVTTERSDLLAAVSNKAPHIQARAQLCGVPAGTLGHLALINPTTGHQVTGTGKAITFTLPDSGTVTGFSFTTSTQVTKITFTLNIGGHPATTSQIFLGHNTTHPATGSPLTYTR